MIDVIPEARIYPTKKRAVDAAKDYYWLKTGSVIRAVIGYTGQCYVLTEKTCVFFLVAAEYDRWSLGRTYEMDGRLYHSGVRVEA